MDRSHSRVCGSSNHLHGRQENPATGILLLIQPLTVDDIAEQLSPKTLTIPPWPLLRKMSYTKSFRGTVRIPLEWCFLQLWA
jgi:hypothetical protein